MRRNISHLRDEGFLLYLDGELPKSQADHARAHLAACWECRARLAETEATITGFVRAYRHTLDSRVTPIAGPRALLKARIAELASAVPPPRAPRFLRNLIPIGTAILAGIVIAAMAIPISTRSLIPRTSSIAQASPVSLTKPVPDLTPGAFIPMNKNDVCVALPDETDPEIPASLKRKVFAAYGIAKAQATGYQVDYLITPGLGGATSLSNLWPQPYSGTVWNAQVKDQLERRLELMVCKGEVDLTVAQQDISKDWIAAYRKYFHSDKPIGDKPV